MPLEVILVPFGTKKIPRDPSEYIRRALIREGVEIKRLFGQIDQGWENKKITVTSRANISPGGSHPGVSVHLDVGALKPTEGNKILSYINFGTAERDIVPKDPTKQLLHFRSGYRPATSPFRIGSVRKLRFGGYVTKGRVRGHSIEPRHFDKSIARERRKFFGKIARDEMKNYSARFWG